MDTTVPLDGEVSSYLELKKADGTLRWFKVVGDVSVEISQQEYEEATA